MGGSIEPLFLLDSRRQERPPPRRQSDTKPNCKSVAAISTSRGRTDCIPAAGQHIVLAEVQLQRTNELHRFLARPVARTLQRATIRVKPLTTPDRALDVDNVVKPSRWPADAGTR